MAEGTETGSGRLVRQLTGLDAEFLAIEDQRNFAHVSGLAVLDPAGAEGGVLALSDMRRLVEERIHLLPPFRWRLESVPLGLDHPWWIEDPDFDIGYHVRELALPKNGTRWSSLREQVARIYSRRLDQARPLSELYLIHGLKGGKVAMVSKIHHATIDGMSGGEIMTILFDMSPEPREVDPPNGETISVPEHGTRWSLGCGARVPEGAVSGTPTVSPGLLPHIDVVPSILGLPGTEQVSKALSQGVRKTVGIERDRGQRRHPAAFPEPPKGAYDAMLSPHRDLRVRLDLTDRRQDDQGPLRRQGQRCRRDARLRPRCASTCSSTTCCPTAR